jgi:hypothetical protein
MRVEWVGQVVHVESEPAESANLLSYEVVQERQGWRISAAFSCIRQIQSKIAGRAQPRDRRGDHKTRTRTNTAGDTVTAFYTYPELTPQSVTGAIPS